MKKIIITIVCVLIAVLVLTIVIVKFSSHGRKEDLNAVKTTFLINQNVKEVNNIDVYYGDKKYYIVDYKKDNINYIGILDYKENLILNEEKSKLYNTSNLKIKNYSIGYKFDKLIYEVKKQSKDGFVYTYYDAITGEFIKNIKLNK